jgi:hypothetical protein
MTATDITALEAADRLAWERFTAENTTEARQAAFAASFALEVATEGLDR